MRCNVLVNTLGEHAQWVSTRGDKGRQAVLRLADLRRADLAYSTLAHADFTGADLRSADMGEVRASGCRFERSDLRSATFGEAILLDAIFRRTRSNWITRMSTRSMRDGLSDTQKRDLDIVRPPR